MEGGRGGGRGGGKKRLELKEFPFEIQEVEVGDIVGLVVSDLAYDPAAKGGSEAGHLLK